MNFEMNKKIEKKKYKEKNYQKYQCKSTEMQLYA